MRQWVLTFPRRVRYHLARDPHLLSAVLTLFHRELSASYAARAQALGITGGKTGAVTFVRPESCSAAGAEGRRSALGVQRFGSALNLNVHLHVVMPDGVFTHDDKAARATFHPLPMPEDGFVEDLLLTTGRKVLELLERHLADVVQVDFSSSLDALLAASVESGRAPPGLDLPPPRNHRLTAHIEGFSLHAGVHIHAHDRKGLERLLGYGGRGPVALSRLDELDDGRFRYRMRRPQASGRTELVLTAAGLVEKLAALVPPPRCNVVRCAPNKNAPVRERLCFGDP